MVTNNAIGNTLDHGILTGLGDDDHLQYTRVDGTRAFTGAQSLGDNDITNVGDIKLDSLTADATTIALNSTLLQADSLYIASDEIRVRDKLGVGVEPKSSELQIKGELGLVGSGVAIENRFVILPASDNSTLQIGYKNPTSFYVTPISIGYEGDLKVPSVYSNTASTRNVYVDSDGEIGYLSSTIIDKTNINLLNVSTPTFQKLESVTFERRLKDEEGNRLEEGNGILEAGLIAESVEKLFPEAVFYDEIKTETGTEKIIAGVNYNYFIPVLIKEVQKLRKELNATKKLMTAK